MSTWSDLNDEGVVLANALVTRAGHYLAQTRLPEALADLDEAASVSAGQPVEATVRAVRARVLTVGGWFADAAQEARAALDLAYATAPALAAGVHMTLAEITSGTGDLPGAAEHLALARDLCAATGDVGGETTALLSSARLAYLASDADRADTLYDEAEHLLADDPYRLAQCLTGRAAVAVLRGAPASAVTLVDQALGLLGATAAPLALVALHQVRGSACEALGEFAAAEACYAEASARCDTAGLWHVALGMTWWRADALVRRAAAVTGDERRTIAARALDLALPAALAAEAVRQRFPAGPLRERWVASAWPPPTSTTSQARCRSRPRVPCRSPARISCPCPSLPRWGSSCRPGSGSILPCRPHWTLGWM
jgi:tetratricopeptide (TPR) repeat protein